MSIEWYYTDNGRQKGPVTEEELRTLVADKKLDPDTQVWRRGFSEWQAFRDSELGSDTDTPPPLSAKHINNSIVWVIAFTPILIAVANAIILQNAIRNGTGLTIIAEERIPWPIVAAILALLGWLDERRLRQAGYSSKLLLGLALFVVPIYLFIRAQKIGQTPYYGFVWIISFVLSLLL